MEVFMNGLAQFVAVMNKILWDYHSNGRHFFRLEEL